VRPELRSEEPFIDPLKHSNHSTNVVRFCHPAPRGISHVLPALPIGAELKEAYCHWFRDADLHQVPLSPVPHDWRNTTNCGADWRPTERHRFVHRYWESFVIGEHSEDVDRFEESGNAHPRSSKDDILGNPKPPGAIREHVVSIRRVRNEKELRPRHLRPEMA
jgi:hypothetical protein